MDYLSKVYELTFKAGFDALVGLLQRFRQHARFPQRGHEIGITGPTRNDVYVDMPWFPGSGGLPNVCADVECLWMINLSQDHDRLCNLLHHFGA